MLIKQINSNQERKLVLYVHGKGGNAEEANFYINLFPDCDVAGLDYQAQTPWEAIKEFQHKTENLFQGYDKIILVANSIGAFYSMYALNCFPIEKAYLISPMVNLEKLIINMMSWTGVTEEKLKEKENIDTPFGERLSYKYLTWVRNNSIKWNIPTQILYGEKDNLQSIDIITEFAEKINAQVTVMKKGEHWFHTDEQMKFLSNWILSK